MGSKGFLGWTSHAQTVAAQPPRILARLLAKKRNGIFRSARYAELRSGARSKTLPKRGSAIFAMSRSTKRRLRTARKASHFCAGWIILSYNIANVRKVLKEGDCCFPTCGDEL